MQYKLRAAFQGLLKMTKNNNSSNRELIPTVLSMVLQILTSCKIKDEARTGLAAVSLDIQ